MSPSLLAPAMELHSVCIRLAAHDHVIDNEI